MKYIYSTYSLMNKTNDFTKILVTQILNGSYYRYTAYNDDPALPIFVYNALICSICINEKHPKSVERMSEYLYMRGYKSLIYCDILKILEESREIHIDGMINFRLRKYMGDIRAFLDMIHFADTIRKGFENLGRPTIKLLEF